MMAAEFVSFWGSWASGVFLFFTSLLVLRAFIPRIRWGHTPASRLLALAIVLGFLSLCVNAAYWQVFGQFAVGNGIITVQELRYIGGFIDMLVKGASGIAALYHLGAIRASLPDDERRRWSLLGVAFYPDTSGVLSKILNTGWRKD